jgi:hypothetical protein
MLARFLVQPAGGKSIEKTSRVVGFAFPAFPL